MKTEKRFISLDEALNATHKEVYWTESEAAVIRSFLVKLPRVDAIPMDDIKLHHILIDNEGVPEVKLQIGDRYFLLRTDPVDVREVVHGYWFLTETEYLNCSVCGKAYYTGIETWSAAMDNLKYAGGYKYCPNCGAKMDGENADGRQKRVD